MTEDAEPTSRRSMWRAVIQTALEDVRGEHLSGLGAGRAKRVRAEAVQWFAEAGEDFQTVCGLADLEQGLVRNHAMTFRAACRA